MPDSIIPQDPLLPGARERYLRSAISYQTWTGESGASVLRSLREAGWGIRTQDFYAIRREKLAEVAQSDQYTAVGDDNLIPYQLMTERGDLSMTKKAQYRLALTVTDSATGQDALVYRSIATDKHFDKRGIISLAETLFTSGGPGYEFEISDIQLNDVWIRPQARLEW